MRSTSLLACVFSTLSLTLAISGCMSTRDEGPEPLTASANDLRARVSDAKLQLDSTLNSLATLTASSGNVKDNFTAYRKSLKELTSANEQAKTSAATLRSQGTEYFGTWQKGSSAISNEDMRESHAERRSELQKDYRELNDAYDDYQRAYDPVIAKLVDVERVLSSDMTPAGIDSIEKAAEEERDGSKNIRDLSDTLNKKIDAFVDRFTSSGEGDRD